MAMQRVIVRGAFNRIVEDREYDRNVAQSVAQRYRDQGYYVVVQNA